MGLGEGHPRQQGMNILGFCIAGKITKFTDLFARHFTALRHMKSQLSSTWMKMPPITDQIILDGELRKKT